MCKELSRGFQKLANDLPRRVKHCLRVHGRSERVVLFDMVPPWPTKEVKIGFTLPFTMFFLVCRNGMFGQCAIFSQAFATGFCTCLVREVMLATITQEMHIAKEASSLQACALIDVTRRSS